MPSTYYFYSKTDSNMESIFTCSAHSIEEARLMFSTGKQMDLETFNKLYEVNIKSR